MEVVDPRDVLVGQLKPKPDEPVEEPHGRVFRVEVNDILAFIAATSITEIMATFVLPTPGSACISLIRPA